LVILFIGSKSELAAKLTMSATTGDNTMKKSTAENNFESAARAPRTSYGTRKLIAKLNRYGKKLALSNAINYK
jgi:hypothetical protein